MYADPITIQLTDEERDFAEADAAALGMNFHDYLRMLIVEGALFELGDDAGMPIVH